MEQMMTSHVLGLCNTVKLVVNLVRAWMHLPMLLVAMFEDKLQVGIFLCVVQHRSLVRCKSNLCIVGPLVT